MTTQTSALKLTPAFLQEKFQSGKSFADYVDSSGIDKQPQWRTAYEQISLTEDQKKLIGSFVREMPVLCLSGDWCGDCVQQCPVMARVAEASDCIDLRLLDRDEHSDLGDLVRICGGNRVPTVIFMAEDFEPVQVFGDRTLTRYRAVAAAALGASCPLPGAPVPAEERAGVVQDWIDIFERNHLLLRTSGRLRQKHND
ncbi:MAG: thioredoxin family protein [Planctomycetota bacterium]